MWSKLSSALKPREGHDSDTDHSDAQSTTSRPPPDPFCANATTYYTQQMPPTPSPRAHSRTASREEHIIWSLRTQLALQQELCAQFEIDLGARDDLVQALTTRLEASERENAKYKNVVRSWKKKAAELERMCRVLEEELDNNRQESVERSIMDEASGEALRQLHRQVLQLEREKSDIEGERSALVQAVEKVEAEITRLRGEPGVTDEASAETLRQLQGQIWLLEQEKNDLQVERETLTQAKEKAEIEALKLQEELNTADENNREAQHQLRDQVSQMQREKGDIETEQQNLSSEISRLRVNIQQLQKDSAVMEVTIVQLNKQLEQDKEDIGGLNIALESKQQELELIKRKHGTQGTIGPTAGRMTTAPNSRILRTAKPSVINALRRASISSMESKTKLPSRGANTAILSSDADEKENALGLVPLKNLRKTTVSK